MINPITTIVLGTRPEIIKLAPLICELRERNLSFSIIHSNQHYSYEMDGLFFEELKLPQPDFSLGVGSGSQGVQTGNIMIGVERILSSISPRTVITQGDTNTTLAASLAATKLHIPVCHVEAGLRSWDKSMPEEVNRVLVDHMSDLLFAPTETSSKNLESENIPTNRTFVSGNTIVDSLKRYFSRISKSTVLLDIGLEKDSYILVTLHRAENVDDQMKLRSLVLSLRDLHEETGLIVFFPTHPRTKKWIEKDKISTEGIIMSKPFGYFDFLNLEANAKLILTDSGGVQEEACVLGVPCVTLRENTERPETIEVGANIIAGTESSKIMKAVSLMIERKPTWTNPFGKGDASSKILDVIESYVSDEAILSSSIENPRIRN